MKIIALLLCLVPLVLVGACSDDEEPTSPPPPPPFQVVLEVSAPNGDPVAGLELGLVSDTPYYMDGKDDPEGGPKMGVDLRWPFPSPFYPSVIIPFVLDRPGLVRVTVEDGEGGLVKLLGERAADAGTHQWLWNGQDDSGAGVPSGVYYARLVLADAGSEEILQDVAREMLLSAFFAFQVLIGTTDEDGRLVLEDTKLFPYLYDLPNFPAMDETGAPMGVITLTPTMRFYFTDPVAGKTMRFDRDVVGATTLKFVWETVSSPGQQ